MSLLPIASRESEQMAAEMEEDFSERENVFSEQVSSIYFHYESGINLSMMSLADSLPNNPSCFSERLVEGIQNV